MTDEERKEFEDMKRRIGRLESQVGRLKSSLSELLVQNGRQARSSARRLRNLLDRDEKFAQLCDDLAASVA